MSSSAWRRPVQQDRALSHPFVLRVVVGAVLSLTLGAAADLEAGHQRAAVCGSCHGAGGVSSMPGVPSLAGQQDQFIQWQLVFFRSGRRENPIMGALAANLTDTDIRNLGAYFASLPHSTKPTAGSLDEALRDRGLAVTQQHHCASCHQDDFRGKQAAATIADQRQDYIVKALSDYRSGARPSTGVAAMNEAASELSDDDIKAVAYYLASY